MQRTLMLAGRAARCDISTLIMGETGVGKDVLARRIHAASPRAAHRFLSLNCAGLPEALAEGELFGYERGAFTGSSTRKQGLLESAQGGTIFLDEIGEMPLGLQVKLLSAVESRQVMRLGSLATRAVDVRFVAATNRDLEVACAEGRFRSDLYFRLAGLVIDIAPLRERRNEIRPLAREFTIAACTAQRRASLPAISAEAWDWLEQHEWPGNVRELKNVIERAVLLCDGDEIQLEHLPQEPRARHSFVSLSGRHAERQAHAAPASASAERDRIVKALAECGGNQSRAAKRLGVSRNTLIARLDRHDIVRPLLRGDEPKRTWCDTPSELMALKNEMGD